MKLFDRSVDFAQFNEDTPLYILARAWMKNKPYGTKTSDSQASSSSQESPVQSQDSAASSGGEASVSVVTCPKGICLLNGLSAKNVQIEPKSSQYSPGQIRLCSNSQSEP